jgi:hypothetical protein
MSDPRPNLFLLFLRAMAVPMAVFAVWSAVAGISGSHRWVLLAGIAGFFLLVILLIGGVYAIRLILRHIKGANPDKEFGITPPVCAGCGYDLRASPDHCPECGQRVDPLDRTIIQYLTYLRRKQ